MTTILNCTPHAINIITLHSRDGNEVTGIFNCAWTARDMKHSRAYAESKARRLGVPVVRPAAGEEDGAYQYALWRRDARRVRRSEAKRLIKQGDSFNEYIKRHAVEHST